MKEMCIPCMAFLQSLGKMTLCCPSFAWQRGRGVQCLKSGLCTLPSWEVDHWWPKAPFPGGKGAGCPDFMPPPGMFASYRHDTSWLLWQRRYFLSPKYGKQVKGCSHSFEDASNANGDALWGREHWGEWVFPHLIGGLPWHFNSFSSTFIPEVGCVTHSLRQMPVEPNMQFGLQSPGLSICWSLSLGSKGFSMLYSCHAKPATPKGLF